ncbi:MAG: 5-methyltetrahydropteroyltriglutamate--homocysteine S-methyltransferase [Deltaproteobacteria bacterium]|nr:5-methyltetrahydropteroyltriglutamate--homocysteine S-methyltransferase [Deltaproteobacteria bacterium]
MEIRTSITGFPRIGEQRELKKALESFWTGKTSLSELSKASHKLKIRHWNYQKESGIDLISSNDFSWYDNMLDTVVMLNAIPERFHNITDETERYFTMARGSKDCVAMEMTKWFNTNYHYIVPELSSKDEYSLNATKILDEYKEAKEIGIKTKINIIGPVTFLALSKRADETGGTYQLFDKVLPVYKELIKQISKLDDNVYVQFDEPVFVKDTSSNELNLLKKAYSELTECADNVKIIVATYFEHSNEATNILIDTPIWGIGLDFIYGKQNLDGIKTLKDKKLIAGVVNGRNIWVNDFEKSILLLNKISDKVNRENIIVSSSCSLLHVPYSLKYEDNLDDDLKTWLSFAMEKLEEVNLISKLFQGVELCEEDKQKVTANKDVIEKKRVSTKIHNNAVQSRLKNLLKKERTDKFEDRIKAQKAVLKYPELATTTIGSFPQTPEIRKLRRDYKNNNISKEFYETGIKEYIDNCIAFQEEIGLDVLVHGEPERNDMVEYFGEMLDGFVFTKNGWVQSYGSRCVKPPVIYGDVSRPEPMTVKWITYAQSKTEKIVKGMITGPVTILKWSFVRDDLPRSVVSEQISVALSDEVADLQNAGIKIIQIDEAAFKEGYPLRKDNIPDYEKWAVRSFKIVVSPAKMETQIHTHMCYSEFNDIIKTIEAMDADVISIETARSGNELLKVFKAIGYKQEVGPGVYDIHSPRVPGIDEIVKQINALLEVLPIKQLWINPDCGLKTRKWEEVKPSLKNMVLAVKQVRKAFIVADE